MSNRLRSKTWIFTAIVILANSFGNLLLAKGERGSSLGLPVDLLWLIPGVGLLIVYMLSRMTLLGWADLTYVLPVTALGYVLSTGLAAIFLGEQVSGRRWLGTVLIVAGTALVAPESARLEQPKHAAERAS